MTGSEVENYAFYQRAYAEIQSLSATSPGLEEAC